MEDCSFSFPPFSALGQRVKCIFLYDGNALDIGINYSVLGLHLFLATWTGIAAERRASQWRFPPSPSLAELEREQEERNARILIWLLALGTACVLQMAWCLLVEGTGISMIWCFLFGWTLGMGRQLATLEQQQQQQHSEREAPFENDDELADPLLSPTTAATDETTRGKPSWRSTAFSLLLLISVVVIVFNSVISEGSAVVSQLGALVLGATVARSTLKHFPLHRNDADQEEEEEAAAAEAEEETGSTITTQLGNKEQGGEPLSSETTSVTTTTTTTEEG